MERIERIETLELMLQGEGSESERIRLGESLEELQNKAEKLDRIVFFILDGCDYMKYYTENSANEEDKKVMYFGDTVFPIEVVLVDGKVNRINVCDFYRASLLANGESLEMADSRLPIYFNEIELRDIPGISKSEVEQLIRGNIQIRTSYGREYVLGCEKIDKYDMYSVSLSEGKDINIYVNGKEYKM